MLFPTPQRVSRACRRTLPGDPGGDLKSIKKRHGKKGAKKNPTKPTLGAHRVPKGSQMSQNSSQMGAKTGPKIDEKSDLQGKAQKLTKTHYLLHFNHIGHLKNRAFFVHFGLLKPASRESPPESMKKDTRKAAKAAPMPKICPNGRQPQTGFKIA